MNNNALDKILSYSKYYKYHYIINIICNLLHSIFSIISIVLISPVLSFLLEIPNENHKKIIINSSNGLFDLLKGYFQYNIELYSYKYGKINTLTIFCIFIILIFFIKNIFKYLAEYILIGIRTSIIRKIKNDFHKKILYTPIIYLSSKKNGDIMSRLSNDINDIENSIIHSFTNLISSPIIITFHLLTLFLISYKLTIFVFLLIPIMTIFVYIIGNSLKKDAKNSQNQLGKLLSIVEETLNNYKIISVFNAENEIQKRFEKVSRYQKELSSRVNRKKELISPIIEFMGSSIMILIIWYGSKIFLEKKEIEPKILFPFIGLFYQIINPSKSLVTSISNIQKGKASAKRISDILNDNYNTVNKKIKLKSIKSFNNEILFNNVTFIHNKRVLLSNFSFSFKKGKTVVIVGKSGCGKSIIADLLAKFYNVTYGKITIDGNNINSLKIIEYRKLLGIITQNPIIFNDSIINNLSLGMSKEISLNKIIKAAKIANAHFFIKNLPNGYNTIIGKNGNKLSIGQKQRISIVRTILKNPPILILDEAIYSIGSESEIIIKNMLNMIIRDKTSLLITNRLSKVFIKNADHIITLDNGKIIKIL
ncbi:ABC transporter ATP-binding protein [Blattabacterium cuenoti]|uniref:ABC transporter ATP-binding protein n=1 Tax=Blattabacterium cuenoti TaxID=1653831 RepID=UPI00163BE760|nr:ABC transporter ATP-binding protein [Blattabacterium cuenoti]